MLELPAAVAASLPTGDPDLAPEFSYSLTYKRSEPLGSPIPPMYVKMMSSGKVTINQHDYYVPTLPCVTDFASIPALEIPRSTTPSNLQAAVGDYLRQSSGLECDHKAYTYNNVPPLLKTFLPVIRSR